MQNNYQHKDFSEMNIDDIDEYRRFVSDQRAVKESQEKRNDTIYVPFEEIGTTPAKEYKEIPAAVRKYIEKDAIFAISISAILIAVLIFISFDFYLLLILIAFDIFCLASGFNAYICGVSDEIVTFDGIVYSCTEHGLRGINKYFNINIYNEDIDRFLSFRYHKKVDIGTPIILYIDKTAKIAMGEQGPEVDSFITVKFAQKLEDQINEGLESGQETVEEYIYK